MIGNNIDIVIIPPNTKRVFKMRMPINMIVFLGAVLLVMFVFTAFVFAKYIESLANKDRFQTLQKNLNIQQLKLKTFQNDLEGYNTKLESFKDFDRKIRIITGQKESILENGSDYDLASVSEKITNRNDVVIHNHLLSLNIGTRKVRDSFMNLESIVHQNIDKLARTPSIIPLRDGHLTSRFGMRNDPFTGKPRMHTGIDWAYLPYTPIIAPAEGVVENIIKSFSYGNLLVINHGYGIKTRYAHLAETNVKKGARILRGQLVARMGGTGARSTAVHLHYEVLKDGEFVNPENYLIDGPVLRAR